MPEPESKSVCLFVASSTMTDGNQETLDARSHYGSSEDDGTSIVRVNQYILKNEIGRGSFGAVHLAVDQYGAEFVRTHSPIRFSAPATDHSLSRP